MERSGFFNAILDSEGTPDRSYSAENFARYFGTFIGNGVFPNPSTNLQIIANADMTVTIKAGRAWINGYMYENDSDLILPIDIADGVLNRIDRIVLRMDTVGRAINAVVKKGQFASKPVAPNLQRDADAYELGIADIYIAAGATSIRQSNITDQRQNQNYCGIVDSLITADTATLFNQFTDGFNTWFNTVKNTFGGDVAGNLLNLINEHKDDKNNPHGVTAAQIGALSAAQGKVLKDSLDAHIDDDIDSEAGVHGFRYYDDMLQFFDGTDWVEIETGGSGVPPSNVINPSIQVDDGQLTIKWIDPSDTVVDGQLISTWAGTKLVRKAGSFPDDEKDGVVLVDNKVRGAYASTGFVDSGLTNDTTYYYQLFPYNDLGAANKNTANRLSAAPKSFKIFGVKIDLTNSNPESSVTYTDNAVGMAAGSSAWDNMAIFKDIKPCVLKNGVVQYYLNPNNFTEKADGTDADITSGDGDVMIEIPKTGFSITTNGNYLYVKVTDNPNNPAFKYYAHSRAVEGDRQKLYIGAYKGFKDDSNKLRSLSGRIPTTNQTIGTFRTQAQANGSGYDMLSFYPLTFIQCLYLIKYKNLDSQTALGKGCTGCSVVQFTGAANTAGMCYGSISPTSAIKLFGIEDFWGNVWEWIDGLFCDSSRNIKTAFQGFNNTGNGYTSRGQGATSDTSGYMSKPQGTSEAGFIVKEASGSSTTYFADSADLHAGYLPVFGGGYSDGANAGAFRLYVYYSASTSGSGIGARLMYL